MNAIEK